MIVGAFFIRFEIFHEQLVSVYVFKSGNYGEKRVRGAIRKIDLSRGLGLHELGNPSLTGQDAFRFQLRYAKEQTQDILLNVDHLISNTVRKAPVRERDFCLKRVQEIPLTHEEDRWERAMYKKWGPSGSGEFVPVCQRIQAYQYPLKSHGGGSKDPLRNKNWGEIDLLGIGVSSLPVPCELKREDGDSPLRMLVEVVAYGFAIQKVWRNLKEDWIQAVKWRESSPAHWPEKLERVTLLCVAPVGYWNRYLGLRSETKRGQFPRDAWPSFWELVRAFQPWFDIYFVVIDGSLNDGANAMVGGARMLDLEGLSQSKSRLQLGGVGAEICPPSIVRSDAP